MTWLPVDYAAKVILDVADLGTQTPTDRSKDHDLAYHVLNPTRFHWARDMLPALASAGLKFETLPTSEWMDRLRQSDRDATKNPPIKLLDWFEGKYGPKAASSAEKGVLEYLTEKTKEDGVSLRNLPDVTDVSYVQMMLGRLGRHWNGDDN
jgi:hypothetical protein